MTDANPTEQTTQTEPQERTFTQNDMDAAINERLKNERKRHAEELSKFSDYEELKSKAAKLDEIEAANKSEIEKAVEALNAANKRAEDAEAKAAKLEADAAHAALVAKVAKEHDVPADLIAGDDEDALVASAQALKAYVEASKPQVPQDKGGGAIPAPETLEQIKAMADGEAKMRALARHHAG